MSLASSMLPTLTTQFCLLRLNTCFFVLFIFFFQRKPFQYLLLIVH